LENQGPRKATDVLLDMESKLDTLLSIVKAQDLNMKLLSNKLNSLIEKLDKQPELRSAAQRPSTPQFTVEAPMMPAAPPPHFVHPATPGEVKQVPINAEYQLPVEESPLGFRRTSRPETYAGDNAYLQKPSEPQVRFPTQTVAKPPPGRNAEPPEFVVPAQATAKQAPQMPPPPVPDRAARQEPLNQGAVPVEQRVVDKNGKSVFLADVEIIDHNTSMPVFKTRTNGAGKWAAPLPLGNYRVNINKRESLTKQKVEVVQDIQVTGSESPLVLSMMIIK
jgi:hypothetical protein